MSFVAGVLLSGPLVEAKTKPDPHEIIKRFAEEESEFKKTFSQYTYTQHILFQVLSRAGRVREQREMVVEIYFTKDGEREERILRDRGALRSVGVSREDIDDALNGLVGLERLDDQRPSTGFEHLADEGSPVEGGAGGGSHMAQQYQRPIRPCWFAGVEQQVGEREVGQKAPDTGQVL